MTTKTFGYLAALGATVIWSGNFIVARGIADVMPPAQLNFWRWVVALICMLPLALPRLKADWPAMRQHWRYLAFMAFLGVTALNTLIYKAGQTTESLNMALLVPTAPVMILVLSRIFYGEAITPRRLVGLFVVLAGVVLLISRGQMENLLNIHFAEGDLLALAGAASFALYSLFIRQRPTDISVEGFNAITFAMGLAFVLPLALWEAAVLPAPTWTLPVWGGVLYAGVGCSFACYLLWTRAIGIIGPVTAGMVYYTLPLFAAVEGVFILGEHITLNHVLGGGLIVAGILTATIHLPHRNQHAMEK